MTGELEGSTRREFLRRTLLGLPLIVSASSILTSPVAEAITIENYFDDVSNRRAARPSTKYIILHTTETPPNKAKGTLERIARLGLANYIVDPDGKVKMTVEKSKIAKHAGRSMWDGIRNIDEHSVGIEVMGYHNQDITKQQYRSLKELISELQKTYKISDDRTLTHSMVAYGAPNRWNRHPHRGRKRCGMLFAKPEVRKKLGLNSKPAMDPDVQARRLVDADPLLSTILYGTRREDIELASTQYEGLDAYTIAGTRTAWFIARDRYNDQNTIYIFPDGKKISGNNITDWDRIPRGTKVQVADFQSPELFEGFRSILKDGTKAKEIAGEGYNEKTTIYFLKDGRVRTGAQLDEKALENLAAGTKILVGYVYGGHISRDRTAYEIVGKRWNYPSTFYRTTDGQIKGGDEINPKFINKGTLVFFRN